MHYRTLVEISLREGERFTFRFQLHAEDVVGSSHFIWCRPSLVRAATSAPMPSARAATLELATSR